MSSARKNFNPSKILVQLFIAVILSGTFLLKLPAATNDGITLPDALFTATSAVCVTGLIVRETGAGFTGFGQMVILILIQIGALGYMSLVSLLVILMRKGVSIKGRILLDQQLSGTKSVKISSFILRVAALTFSFQAIGAIVLFWRMKDMFDRTLTALYFAVFHSVSAFCNAGFDLFPGGTSLSTLRGDSVVVLLFTVLIITGGIGYIVVNDIYDLCKSKIFKRTHKLLIHTKIVLTVTFFLIIFGTLVFYIAEFNNPETLKNIPMFQKWLMAFFQAVTPRTAGFSMISTSHLINFSIIFTMILMFIGASPGGTGGGIKTTTIAVLAGNIKSIVRGEKDVSIFRRRVASRTVRNSVAIFTISIFFIVTVTLLITVFDGFSIKRIFFEVVSAFSTVGLSTGITGDLSNAAKMLIVLTMFFGRLGPLTIVAAIVRKSKKISYRYPEQDVAIG